MTTPAARPSEAQLHAYVDGFATEAERAEIERYLTDHPGEALRIEAYRRQNEALLALRDQPDARPFTMPEFRPRIVWPRVLAQAVAAVLLLAVGSAGGWLAHGHLQPEEPPWMKLVQQAERAHLTFAPEVVHPVEVAREQEQHLRSWISKRLGAPVTVPVLTAHGFELVGGRLLPANPGPAAQFMYQDARGARVTLYVLAAVPGRKDTAFRYVQSGPLWICYWIGESMDFALIGELERDSLIEIAKTAYMQLNNVAAPALNQDW